MEWRSQGILLSVRKHGETSVIADIFFPDRGRHSGVVRGGTSRKLTPILQQGAQLDVLWRARLEEHIGSFQIELIRSRAAQAMSDRLMTAGLSTVSAILSSVLPERQSFPSFYRQTEDLLDLMAQPDLWPLAYFQWEMRLLSVLGFGLDLSRCAVTKGANDLSYVSPKTGRAVSRSGAGKWAPKLLPLPPVAIGNGSQDADIIEGLALTGYFLQERIFNEIHFGSPQYSRQRFLDLLGQRAQCDGD